MRVTVIQRKAHDGPCAQSVASGLRMRGHVVTVQNHTGVTTKHVACWGWSLGRHLREQGHEVLVMERGYLGDRFAWYSLGWNGLNGDADHRPYPQDDTGQRFLDAYGKGMNPWKTSGDYVLLLGQVPGDAALRGQDLMNWYRTTALRAHNQYELPVRFRNHPQALAHGIRLNPGYTEAITGTLEETLDRAFCAITFNSTSAVDAVLAGVPTVAVDRGCMAWPVTSHAVGDIARPDRGPWASRLAWKQWRLTEIARGIPFDFIPGATS